MLLLSDTEEWVGLPPQDNLDWTELRSYCAAITDEDWDLMIEDLEALRATEKR